MKTSIFLIILYSATIFGWGRCLYKFCKCDFESSYKAEVIYGVGVFTGLGAVLGYFNWGK